MVSLGEELRKLRARHKTAWMLEWGLGNSFQKDVQNLVSKQSFARWLAILSVFLF